MPLNRRTSNDWERIFPGSVGDKENSEKLAKLGMKILKYAAAMQLLFIAFYLSVLGLVGWAVFHFLHKHW
jgi:hypothetical protein